MKIKKLFCLIAVVLVLTVLCIRAVAADTFISGYFRYTVDDSSVTITLYTGTSAEVTVPSMISGNPVNTIASGAFASNKNVKVVHLPDTITSVEEGAFAEGQRVIFSFNVPTTGTTAPEQTTTPTEVTEPAGTTAPIVTPTTAEQTTQADPDITVIEEEHVSGKFYDVDISAWYVDAIDYVVEKGIMIGNGDGTFAPDENMSRAMLVQILFNIEKRPADFDDSHFADVKKNEWYYPAVSWAASSGLVEGFDGKFLPDDDITREEFVTILARYEVFKGDIVSSREDLSGFSDADGVSSWALGSMKWAVSEEIIRGYEDGTLRPKDTATRAEIAQAIMNYLTR